MSRQTQPVKLTYEDYVRIPEDGNRHEIIDGEHYVTPAPNTIHQRILVRLTGIIAPFLRDRRLGELLVAPVDIVLSPTNIVQPDLVFISAARASIITYPNIQGAPDLAIEILSKGTRRRDETLKRKLYEQFGIGEYWVVDPELETVKVYRLTASGYTPATELSKRSADRLTTPLLPGLELPLSEIFL
jgi:Uma2 family endonuclease